jgi:hypothetical protein
MSERSDRPAPTRRLVLDFGEVVEPDGSLLYDPTAERPMPAVVLRMPPHRAAWLGRVLDRYTRVCRLTADEGAADESGPAWALARAASAAGHVEPHAPAVERVTDAHRMFAGAALRRSEADMDTTTMIAVVDAAARWLEEPDGEQHAYALLGAVTDGPTHLRAYSALLGTTDDG